MSTVVGAFEAKTHFSELLERAARGETITVCRHGSPVAQLGPLRAAGEADIRETIDQIRQLRDQLRLDGLSIRELMYEGRR